MTNVFESFSDNIIEMLIHNQFERRIDSPLEKHILYDFHLKGSEEEYECDDQMLDCSSDSSLAEIPCNAFTAINREPMTGLEVNESDTKVKVESDLFLTTKAKRMGLQGRKPQVGSPLITEEFKIDNRYQCKVCFRSYQWKKSLVRHYKELHPNNVPKVTQ